jgi:ATP-dependent helicase/DNAse subunit B
VQVAPLVENQTLACQTCQYQTLCRFDRAYNQPQKAEVCLPTLDEMDAECS